MFDALAGLADIEDPKVRALAAARVLKEWPDRSKALREIRRQAVLELLAPEGATFRGVAKELGVKPSTLQDIASEYSRWSKRPKKDPEQQAE
ncbi:MAG TPA: hypothetical protein VGA42_08475 [Gemmatimonadales bacterium]